jgi:pectate lyase
MTEFPTMRYKSMPLSVRSTTPWTDAEPGSHSPAPQRRSWWIDWLLTMPVLLLIPVILVPFLVIVATGPTLTVAGSLTAGGEMVVEGTAFPANKRVELRWDGTRQSWLSGPKADRAGRFSVRATLPLGTAAGEHQLSAVIKQPRGGGPAAKTSDIVVASTAVIVSVEAVAIGSPTPSPAPSSAGASPTPAPTASPTHVSTSTAVPTAAATPTESASAAPSSPPATGGMVVGYGAGTDGGSGGSRVLVTNLNDSGAGSLRAALGTGGRRTVVFRVGGTITLGSDLKVSDPYLTVAGETAPLPGITLRNGALVVRTHDVVLRHLRLRPGDQTDTPSDTDALTLNGVNGPVYNVVVDHVTMVWGPDIGGLAILGDVSQATIQNSIMGEGLYLSRHPEATVAQGGHSHAANVTQLDANLAAPRSLTFWRNLFTTSDSRIPRFQGAKCVDVVNNVIYNWGRHSAHGNPRSLNLVNNWYRSGPETTSELFWRTQTSMVAPDPFSGAVYMAGNVADGVRGGRDDIASVYTDSVRCGGLSVAADSAKAAYAAVLSGTGATAPARDAVDVRIIGNVATRTGTFFNGAGYRAPTPYW